MKKASAGFTLIELLVVIGIIGTLSSITVTSLNQSRANSRDSIRVQQVREIVKAMSVYASETGLTIVPSNINPDHPRSACLGLRDGEPCWGGAYFSGSTLNYDQLVPKYIKEIPADPQPNRAVGDRYVYTTMVINKGCVPLAYESGFYVLYVADDPNANPMKCAIGEEAC